MRFFWKSSCCQRAVVATLGDKFWQSPWFCRKKFNLLNFSRFFSASFSAVISPVRGWLQVRFSLRAGNATIFKKNPIMIANKKSPLAAALDTDTYASSVGVLCYTVALFSGQCWLSQLCFVSWGGSFLNLGFVFLKAICIKRLVQVEEVLRVRQQFKQLETQSNTTWFVLKKKVFFITLTGSLKVIIFCDQVHVNMCIWQITFPSDFCKKQ